MQSSGAAVAARATAIPISLRLLLAVLAVAIAMASALAPLPAEAGTARARPKAVVIVGPVGSLTDDFMATGRRVAAQAEAAGMRVRRVFHPAATWANVLAAIQGANLVVYVGHGNGWPSPHAPYQENTKDGFGLNPSVGASSYSVDYRGADHLRRQVKLAPGAVVLLYRSCYAAGNGERWMGAERDRSVAVRRVDNYAAGFLDVGASAVFAFGTTQSVNIPRALMRSSLTMDQIFRARGSSSPAMYDGYQGWGDFKADSNRTRGARLHLDPHRYRGYLRALTGDLGMTAARWRGKAGAKPKPPRDTKPPRIGQVAMIADRSLDLTTASIPRFSPDGDGRADRLRIEHSLSEDAELKLMISDQSGKTVRTITRDAKAGPGQVAWNGLNDKGRTVRDGLYHLKLVARDKAGNRSKPRHLKARVTTTLRAYRVSRRSLHVSDDDRLARQARLRVEVTQAATVEWRIQDQDGRVVRTLRDRAPVRARMLERTWDGRNDRGRSVRDGLYTALVIASTEDVAVRYRRDIWVGAYRITSSQPKARRGERITFTLRSTEPLTRAPRIMVKQPGLEPYELEASKAGKDTYEVTFKPRSKGKARAGEMRLTVIGRDRTGRRNVQEHAIRLR